MRDNGKENGTYRKDYVGVIEGVCRVLALILKRHNSPN